MSIPTMVLAGLAFHEGAHFLAHYIVVGGVPSVVRVEWMAFVVPVVVADYTVRTIGIILAGPLVGIAASSLIALNLRFTKHVNAFGPVQGENRWYTIQFVALGLLMQAIRDAFYLWPIVDPVPYDNTPSGDGIAAAVWFANHDITIAGQNPQWLIAIGATVGVIGVIVRTWAHSPFVNARLATTGL